MAPTFRSAMRSDLRRLAPLAVVAVAALLLLGAAPASAGDVAVVVNKDVKVDDLAFAELRKILLGDRQFWPSGQPVTLLVQGPSTPERKMLLEKIYKMNEAQFKQYWIAKVFRAEASAGPKVVLSNEMAVQLVAALPGAVALVDARAVPAGVKVLKIDGLPPGDKGYPLSVK